MIFGNDEIFECPKCKKLLYRPTLCSYNTVGSKRYSDLRIIEPMFPQLPLISKCPKCKTIFWLDQKNKTEYNFSDKHLVIEDKPYAQFLSIEDNVLALLEKNYTATQQERDLRLDLMNRFNDRVINGKPLFDSKKEETIWKKNLEETLLLLDDTIQSDKILMAEIYRYMGDFERSREVIQCINNEEFKSSYQQFIEQLRVKNTKVFELK